MPDPTFLDPLQDPGTSVSPQVQRSDPFVRVRTPAPQLREVPDFTAHLSRIGESLQRIYRDEIKARDVAGLERARGLVGSPEFQERVAQELSGVPNPTRREQARAYGRAFTALGVTNPVHQMDALRLAGERSAFGALVGVAAKVEGGAYDPIGGLEALDRDIAAAHAEGLGPLVASGTAEGAYRQVFEVERLRLVGKATVTNAARRREESRQLHVTNGATGSVSGQTNGFVHLGLQTDPALVDGTIGDISAAARAAFDAGHDPYEYAKDVVESGLARLEGADARRMALERFVADFRFPDGSAVTRPDGQVAGPAWFGDFVALTRDRLDAEEVDEVKNLAAEAEARVRLFDVRTSAPASAAAQLALTTRRDPVEAARVAILAWLDENPGEVPGLSPVEREQFAIRQARQVAGEVASTTVATRNAVAEEFEYQLTEAHLADDLARVEEIIEAMPADRQDAARARTQGVPPAVRDAVAQDPSRTRLEERLEAAMRDAREQGSPSAIGSAQGALSALRDAQRAALNGSKDPDAARAALHAALAPLEDRATALESSLGGAVAAGAALGARVDEVLTKDPSAASALVAADAAITEGARAELNGRIASAAKSGDDALLLGVNRVAGELLAQLHTTEVWMGSDEATQQRLDRAALASLTTRAREAATDLARAHPAGVLGLGSAVYDARAPLVEAVLDEFAPDRDKGPIDAAALEARELRASRFAANLAVLTRESDVVKDHVLAAVQVAGRGAPDAVRTSTLTPLAELAAATTAKRGPAHDLRRRATDVALGLQDPAARRASFAALATAGEITANDVRRGFYTTTFSSASDVRRALEITRTGTGDPEARAAFTAAVAAAVEPGGRVEMEVAGATLVFRQPPRMVMGVLKSPTLEVTLPIPAGPVGPTLALSERGSRGVTVQDFVQANPEPFRALLGLPASATDAEVREAAATAAKLARLYGR